MKKSLSLTFSILLVLVLALAGCSSKSGSDGKVLMVQKQVLLKVYLKPLKIEGH